MIESLVEKNLTRMLNERGIEVQQTCQRVEGSYETEEGKTQSHECDILAINGNEAVVVEVKTTLRPSYVKEFLESLKVFTKCCTHYKGLKVYGSVAYLKSDSKATKFAEKQGLFVIRATGDSASIINNKDFKLKVFV